MQPRPFAGLCADCRHVKIIQSAKGSRFIMCGLAKIDPHFPKYPPLPVLRCSGYEPPPKETEQPKHGT